MRPSREEQESRLARRLQRLAPTFTARQAREAALPSRDLAILRYSGDIYELSYGVYRRADAPETAYSDLLAAHIRAPHAVICGLSALALHELVDDIPAAVFLAVPRGSTRPTIVYPPTVVTQYADQTFTLGIEQFEVAPGERVPVYNAARCVVDAMRHRNRIGESLALTALGRYLRRGQKDVRELMNMARALNAVSTIRPAVEAILSR